MDADLGDLDRTRNDPGETQSDVDEPTGSISVRSPVGGVVSELAVAGFMDAVEVGRGGFGVVYRCRQVGLGRLVGVKVLTVELEDNRARFVREQQAMAQLTGHPNIVSVLQVGEIGGHPFLVMPFCEAGSVGDRIAELGVLGVDEVLRLGVKMAAALASAHRLGIVHRDVKPANILLTDYGEPALGDFGIARIAGAGFKTVTGFFVGSPAFTAPEIVNGDRPSPASDVYGLGATLFCGLTGHGAFERRDGEELVAQFVRITQAPLPDLREYQVPDDVAGVVEQAMARNPADRPTAEGLGELLQGAQARHGLPVDTMALHSTPLSALGGGTPAPMPGAGSPVVSVPGARPDWGAAAPVVSFPAAEYKQVTVLFADVVDSMDLAAAVGAERFREIMAELVTRASAVVRRLGGTVDKFTGDGIMAVFGAPAALEDHAFRACLAGLGIQDDAAPLALEVEARDGVALRLRVGLNSGEVIAGEVGSRALGYTAMGTAVGMAQRMEAAAPPQGVLLSESTARLVEDAAVLGEPETVRIKGAAQPVCARRLLGVSERRGPVTRAESNLVGRRWEMAAIEGRVERAIDGQGGVACVVGLPGIGKSRVVREIAAIAAARGVDVFSAFCESHTSDIAFHVVAQLLRAVTGVADLDGPAARSQLRTRARNAEPEDLLLFDDLLGIADPEVELPKIDPDARRRRLTALVNEASLAREAPVVYVIEDAHWIDEVSESMLAEFLTVIPQTPSLVLITHRPEYRGALSRVAGAQTIALEPLSDRETAALVAELLGADPSVGGMSRMIAHRAAGNPFFAEEMVRDLAERGVLRGHRGAYTSTADVGEVSVPATLQATIAARIDRLDPRAKRTLGAAAVVGSGFSRGLLETLGIDPALHDLVGAELIDQTTFTGQLEYVFRHPLIRTVAYESQLRSDRAELHRRIAAAIESRAPAAADENAALIAEHLEAAGDGHAAYGWQMRAATWATNRDIAAAWRSWERARTIADSLPADDPNRLAMRIAPRTMLCGIAFRVHEHVAGDRFDELRELCAAAGDKPSLAIAMAGLVMDHALGDRLREASQLASEAMAVIESIDDPTLTVGLSVAPIFAKGENAEYSDVLRWSQRVIDLADGDPAKGNFIIGSPLALALTNRAIARYALGRGGWREGLQQGLAMARSTDPMSYVTVAAYVYFAGIAFGVLVSDDRAVREIENALRIAERSGDDLALALARMTLGVALVHRDTGMERDRGQKLLTEVSDAVRQKYLLSQLSIIEVYLARERLRRGDRDDAIPLMLATVDHLFRKGLLLGWGLPMTGALVETLLDRGSEGDVAEAEAAIERLAREPAEEALAIREVWLLRLRALLARARGHEADYSELVQKYRALANSLGFQGHIEWAEAM